MDFNSLIFLGFFAAVAVLTYCVPTRIKPYFLLAASYLFYLYKPENARLIWVLICATLLSWGGGILLGYSRIHNLWLRRGILLVNILFCGFCLFQYKYCDFFTSLLSGLVKGFGGEFHPKSLNIIAPLGLSYFLFQSMGYLFDVYRHKQKPILNLAYYALFVSFFPCIFTGPIERAHHLVPQFFHPEPFEYQRMSGGAFRMLWGYFKKMVLADGIGAFVGTIYANPENAAGPYLLAASLLFSYQLYLDFSGCCDIAIGGARILGFELTENFQRPFASCNYGELWRRWHISLSSWFRDYLYIPLGGNRCSVLRNSLNTIVTFLVSGLWHGASWGYIIWGTLNGVILVIGKQTHSIRHHWEQRNPLYRSLIIKHTIKRICVYLLFTACIVFFAADLYGGNAFTVYSGLFQGWNLSVSQLLQGFVDHGLPTAIFYVLVIGCTCVELVEWRGPVALWIRRRPAVVRWLIYYLLILAILFFASFGKSAFIYQNY